MVSIKFEPGELYNTLVDRGSRLFGQAMSVRHHMELHARSGKSAESFDISAIIKKKKDQDAFYEVHLMKAEVKKAEEAEIKEGIKKLSKRILSDDAFPDVPASVWDDAFTDKYANTREYTGAAVEEEHIAAIQKHFPTLDRDVIYALLDASDYDLLPQEMVVAFGGHFALQGWDKEKLQKMLAGMHESCGNESKKAKLASKSYAELIVDLTTTYLGNSNNACGRACGSDMDHFAGIVGEISLGELKQIAKKEGIKVERGPRRPSLIVKIIEHIYADALGPLEGKSDDSEETRKAKKARTSKN